MSTNRHATGDGLTPISLTYDVLRDISLKYVSTCNKQRLNRKLKTFDIYPLRKDPLEAFFEYLQSNTKTVIYMDINNWEEIRDHCFEIHKFVSEAYNTKGGPFFRDQNLKSCTQILGKIFSNLNYMKNWIHKEQPDWLKPYKIIKRKIIKVFNIPVESTIVESKLPIETPHRATKERCIALEPSPPPLDVRLVPFPPKGELEPRTQKKSSEELALEKVLKSYAKDLSNSEDEFETISIQDEKDISSTKIWLNKEIALGKCQSFLNESSKRRNSRMGIIPSTTKPDDSFESEPTIDPFTRIDGKRRQRGDSFREQYPLNSLQGDPPQILHEFHDVIADYIYNPP